MSKILGVDYGTRRVGLSISDVSNVIAFPLCTVKTEEILQVNDLYNPKDPWAHFITNAIKAKELFPNGWNALKPYLRIVSDPTNNQNK